jgi:GNAT superfamily N-acetyltransferase
MKRLYRSLAHNYAEGGIPLLLKKTVGVAAQKAWSRTEWLVYEQETVARSSLQSFSTKHKLLNFDELERLGYSKALAFPENIRERFARGDTCHGFFHSGQLVTLGWSGANYMELNIGETLECPNAWGLFDFVTMPTFQLRGYYTDALKQLARLAHEGGFKSLWIAVHPANIASIKGIERAGFRPARKVSKRRVLGVSILSNKALKN